MKLRIATLSDLDQIVSLGRLMHAESSFSTMDYDEPRFINTVTGLIDSGQFVVVAEINGAIVGGMIGICTQSWFGREMIANDMALFIHPNHRGGFIVIRLIKAFVQWARLAGAKQIRPGVSTGNKTTQHIYEKLGFVNCGANFVMEN